jgi:hypothetical protein
MIRLRVFVPTFLTSKKSYKSIHNFVSSYLTDLDEFLKERVMKKSTRLIVYRIEINTTRKKIKRFMLILNLLE